MRLLRRTFLVALASLLVAGLLVLAATASRDPLPVVDFAETVQEPPAPAPSPGATSPVLQIAVAAMISPKAMRGLYDDLLRLIAARAGRRAVFVQRKTYAEINTMLEQRQVDVAFVCSGPYVIGHDRFGLELLVVPQVDGERSYRSYLIVRKDSPYTRLDDLRGRTFAFTDPDSNTGSLVIRHELASRGESPELFFRETFFTHAHDNSIRAVAEGMADGAAVDSLIYDALLRGGDAATMATRVIHRSPPYGIPPVVVHPALNLELKRRLKRIFLGLHLDAEAAPLLRRLHIDRFVTAEDSLYASVREMQRWLKGAPHR